MTEAQIQGAILKEFGSKPDIRLWRQNTGAAVPFAWVQQWLDRFMPPDAQIPMISFGLKGAADLSGIIRTGVPTDSGWTVGLRLEIEVKGRYGRQSDQQKKFQAMIEKLGGIYILARSTDDVYRELEARGYGGLR